MCDSTRFYALAGPELDLSKGRWAVQWVVSGSNWPISAPTALHANAKDSQGVGCWSVSICSGPATVDATHWGIPRAHRPWLAGELDR